MFLVLRVFYWYIGGRLLTGVAHTSPKCFQLASSSLQTFRCRITRGSFTLEAIMLSLWRCRIVLGPLLSLIQLPPFFIGCTGLFYRPFGVVALSLVFDKVLNDRWHKSPLVNNVSGSETKATVLGVSIIWIGHVLGHGLRWYMLAHSSNLLGVHLWPTAFLPQTIVFRRSWPHWRRTGIIGALTFFSAPSQSIFSSSYGRSRLMLVITGAMTRCAWPMASFLYSLIKIGVYHARVCGVSSLDAQ